MPPHWLREQGSKVLRWIENASEPACPIVQHTPCFSQIVQEAEVKVGESREFPSDLREIPVIPGTGPDKPPCTFFSVTYNQGVCTGITAPGVMIIENICRHRTVTTNQPHSTEIALAFYSRAYPLESLRHVFVSGIVNTQTRDYLESHLYSKIWPRDSIVFQRTSSEYQNLVRTQIWEYGSEEFETLMGTRIGRTVAYLVLGAFPRGTRHITRILVYVVHVWNYHFEFRFDIEPIITHLDSTA